MSADGPGGPCRLCGGSAEPLLDRMRDPTGRATGTWRLLRCDQCGSVWLDPAPTSEELAAAYRAYYTHETSDSSSSGREPSTLAWAVLRDEYGYRDLRPGRLAKWLGRLGPVRDSAGAEVMYLPAQRGRLLDVGCGNGTFLAMMQRLGWEVAGLEPDAAAVRGAPESVRVAIRVGPVEAARFEPASFDAITLNHVIEHLADPFATLRRCAEWLRPGGSLVVLTPNATSLGRRLFHRHWLHWDPPRHQILFTPPALAACVTRAGLEVAEVRTSARAARWTWQASRANGCGATPGRARGPGAVLFQLVEHTLLLVGPFGEEIVLIARRDAAAAAAAAEPLQERA